MMFEQNIFLLLVLIILIVLVCRQSKHKESFTNFENEWDEWDNVHTPEINTSFPYENSNYNYNLNENVMKNILSQEIDPLTGELVNTRPIRPTQPTFFRDLFPAS